MWRLTALSLLVLPVVACGPYDRAGARAVAAAKACDWYQSCGEIGQGGDYATRGDCELDMENTFNNLWSSSACEEIAREDLEVCLKAIEITSCNNAFDILNTLFNKCGAGQVCGD